jgi:hypothetical protein
MLSGGLGLMPSYGGDDTEPLFGARSVDSLVGAVGAAFSLMGMLCCEAHGWLQSAPANGVSPGTRELPGLGGRGTACCALRI